MRGEPIEEPQPAKPEAAPRPVAGDGPRNYERTLSRAERVRLAELRESEGWPVLTWLLERAMQIHKKNAITMSVADPLGRQREIAEAWAYVAMIERAVAELKGQVDAEIAQLEIK